MFKRFLVLLIVAQIVLINTYCFCHDVDLVQSGSLCFLTENEDDHIHFFMPADHDGVHRFFNNSSNINDICIKSLSVFSHHIFIPETGLENYSNDLKIYVDYSFLLSESSIPLYLDNSSMII